MVEILVSMAILLFILAVVLSVTQLISQTWGRSTAKVETFQAGRNAFDAMTRQISQATLNTCYDYFDVAGNSRAMAIKANTSFVPARYGRYSDLRFISGKGLVSEQVGHSVFFQASVGYTDDTSNYGGMDTLLNACGYYVSFGTDATRPAFLDSLPNKPPQRYRFRLMQFLQPDQKLAIYNPTTPAKTDWFLTPLAATHPPTEVMAENVIVLVVLPKLSQTEQDKTQTTLTTDFEFDTQPATVSLQQGKNDYQLPPVVELAMVVMDETSALRTCTSSGQPDFGIPGGLKVLFQDTAKLESDLKTLTDAMVSKHVAYRVFRNEVAVRGAKWSSQ